MCESDPVVSEDYPESRAEAKLLSMEAFEKLGQEMAELPRALWEDQLQVEEEPLPAQATQTAQPRTGIEPRTAGSARGKGFSINRKVTDRDAPRPLEFDRISKIESTEDDDTGE